MTDGLNNPNNSSDEDWAMSEPDIPVKKEVQAKPVDEKAASLYAPPDTGDLEDWDITVKDVGQPQGEASLPPPPNASPPPQFNEPPAFTPPQKAFEILKPVAPPRFKDEDWGMPASAPKNDGWKMPAPTYRVTEGEILTRVRKSSSKSNAASVDSSASAAAQENLPGIYAPPDTADSIEDAAEDFDLPETQEQVLAETDFGAPLPAAGSPASTAQMPAQSSAPRKSRKWLFIILGFLAAGALILILLAGVFGWFFYNSKH